MVVIEREYFCSLEFSALSEEQLIRINESAVTYHQRVYVTPNILEFSYLGNDTSRHIVRFLADIAKIVGDAIGEISCEVGFDEGDDEFEFYSIRNGSLFLQRAHIVREVFEEVKFVE